MMSLREWLAFSVCFWDMNAAVSSHRQQLSSRTVPLMLHNARSAQTVSPSHGGKTVNQPGTVVTQMVTMAWSFMLDEVPEKRKSNLCRAFTLSQFLEKWWVGTFELVDLLVDVYHGGTKQFRLRPPLNALLLSSHIMAWLAMLHYGKWR